MQVVAGILVLALLGGLLYALWEIFRNARRRSRRIAAQLSEPIVAASSPLVVRNNRKLNAACAVFMALLAANGLEAALSGSTSAVIAGVLLAALFGWIALRFARCALEGEPVLVVDGGGFSTPSTGRIPWDVVAQVRVRDRKGRYGESYYGLVFELTTEAGREDVEVDLQMLSMRWNDVAAEVQNRLGRRLVLADI